MSAEEANISQVDVSLVLALCIEPSYVSEIARKLRVNEFPLGVNFDLLPFDEGESDRTWADISENNAVRRVANIAFILGEQDDVIEKVNYSYDQEKSSPENLGVSQKMGSIHMSFSSGGFTDETEWRDYLIIENVEGDIDNVGEVFLDEDMGWLVDKIRNVTDFTVTVDDKLERVKQLSRFGNDVSKITERIMQDSLSRQFKFYDEVGVSDYNDPGTDFWVFDENKMNYALLVEISTRWVNPIGRPYVDKKLDLALDLETVDTMPNSPFDVLILAPKFTDGAKRRARESDLIEIDEVPRERSRVMSPFVFEDDSIYRGGFEGSPIIHPDDSRVILELTDGGHVSQNYPVVTESTYDFEKYTNDLNDVNRDSQKIVESVFRNQVRESIEIFLPNFLRPYKIEQFLIDFYWDKNLTQSEVGRLVDRAGSTIGDWMAEDKWDIITRGTGAPELSQETREIWRRMYLGLDPFIDENGNPIQYSGYRIQAEYNRHPYWTLSDWGEWYQNTTEEERLEVMTQSDDFRSNIDYTILLGPEDRIQPSYSFILRTLKRIGVEIRDEDTAPRVPYRAYANRETLDYMINRNSGTVAEDTEGEQILSQADVEVFDSYLEVDVATWLSQNEISFAHEPFTIPSLFGPNRQMWDDMVRSVREIGRGVDEGFGGRSAFEILNLWNEIYDKHRLQDEVVTVPVRDSLARFAKNFVLPDLVVYEDTDPSPKPLDWEGWDSWDYILEVSGLYGVGIPEDSEEEEWFQWYRVAGVAFKEFAYRMLGIWDDVYFLIPNQPFIEGISDGVPNGVRDDNHYIIFNTTSANIDLTELGIQIGKSTDAIDMGLSPPITPTEYERNMGESGEMRPIRYTYTGIDYDNLDVNEKIFPIGDRWLLFDGYFGDVYISPSSIHVRESQWRDENMTILQEYILDVLSELSEDQIIEGLQRV